MSSFKSFSRLLKFFIKTVIKALLDFFTFFKSVFSKNYILIIARLINAFHFFHQNFYQGLRPFQTFWKSFIDLCFNYNSHWFWCALINFEAYPSIFSNFPFGTSTLILRPIEQYSWTKISSNQIHHSKLALFTLHEN